MSSETALNDVQAGSGTQFGPAVVAALVTVLSERSVGENLSDGQRVRSASMAVIERVREEDLEELLPLMRGYCDFYGVDPSDADLTAMSRALIAGDRCEGVQLLARDDSGRAIGFATIFWSWSTLSAARIGVMNDLFVDPGARGGGVADELIAACAEVCRRRGGVASLGWQTAKGNHRAQAVYERVGGKRAEWLDYSLELER